MNETYDEAVNNIDYKKIMDKVCSRYNRYVDPHDLSSMRHYTLWQCLEKYDPKYKTKFTSYLYSQLTFAIKNSLKKKKREFTNIPIEKSRTPPENIELLLSDFPPEYRGLLRQKYLGNMTMEEIGQANGYSRETARRKIKKALKFYADLSREENEDRSLMQRSNL